MAANSEQDPLEPFFIALRAWKLCVAGAVLGGIAGLAFTLTRPESHVAQCALMVNAAEPGRSDLPRDMEQLARAVWMRTASIGTSGTTKTDGPVVLLTVTSEQPATGMEVLQKWSADLAAEVARRYAQPREQTLGMLDKNIASNRASYADALREMAELRSKHPWLARGDTDNAELNRRRAAITLKLIQLQAEEAVILAKENAGLDELKTIPRSRNIKTQDEPPPPLPALAAADRVGLANALRSEPDLARAMKTEIASERALLQEEMKVLDQYLNGFADANEDNRAAQARFTGLLAKTKSLEERHRAQADRKLQLESEMALKSEPLSVWMEPATRKISASLPRTVAGGAILGFLAVGAVVALYGSFRTVKPAA